MRTRLAAVLVVAIASVIAPSAMALDWPGRGTGLQADWDAGGPADRTELLADLMSADDPAVLDLLRQGASSRDTGVRAETARAIGRTGAWALEPLLVDLLTDRRPDVRIAAAEALGALRTPGAVEPLVRARGDADDDVRVAVIQALGALGDPDATLAVVDALRDSDRDVVVAALEALGRLGHRGALYAVLEKLHDPMREVSVAAAGVVAELRAIEGVPALVELVESGVPDVALAAIDALGALRSRAATPSLVGQVIEPRVEGARSAALDALVATGDPAALVLVDALGDLSAVDLTPLVAAIGLAAADELAARYARLGPETPGAESVLRLWLVSGDPAAVDALEDAWDSGAVVADRDARMDWLRLSPTGAAWCRLAEWTGVPSDTAGWDLLLSGARAPGAADCLIGLIDDVETLAPSVAVQVVTTLADVGRVEAVQLAERFVDPDRLDAEDALTLILALRALGDAGAPGLARILTSEQPAIRRDAANALADRTGAWVDVDQLGTWLSWRTVRVDVLLALDGQRNEPAVAEAVARSTRSSALDVRTAARAIAACDAVDTAALATDRGTATPLLYRREAWRVSFACGQVGADDVEAGELDASVRAMAMAASEAAAPAYDSLSSRDERLVAIGRMSDTATLDALLREREPVLAAAAVLRLGAVADAASRLAWLRGAAAEAPVLRAAWYASAPDDAGAREWALRRETHPGVRAVLAGATALSAPVIVSAYDQTTGAPRPNELVVGFTADGSLVHARTDVFGRVRWDRDDLRAVFVVGEAL